MKAKVLQEQGAKTFAIVFDTFHDRQNGFMFATTPAGVEYDAQIAHEGEGGGIGVTGQTRAVSDANGAILGAGVPAPIVTP